MLNSWLLLHFFQWQGYKGDNDVMSLDLRHKKCRIKVFVMFCYLDGKNGSLSRFAYMEPSLGNLSKYRGVQQQPNIQSVFHKRWRKKWPRPWLIPSCTTITPSPCNWSPGWAHRHWNGLSWQGLDTMPACAKCDVKLESQCSRNAAACQVFPFCTWSYMWEVGDSGPCCTQHSHK